MKSDSLHQTFGTTPTFYCSALARCRFISSAACAWICVRARVSPSCPQQVRRKELMIFALCRAAAAGGGEVELIAGKITEGFKQKARCRWVGGPRLDVLGPSQDPEAEAELFSAKILVRPASKKEFRMGFLVDQCSLYLIMPINTRQYWPFYSYLHIDGILGFWINMMRYKIIKNPLVQILLLLCQIWILKCNYCVFSEYWCSK